MHLFVEKRRDRQDAAKWCEEGVAATMRCAARCNNASMR